MVLAVLAPAPPPPPPREPDGQPGAVDTPPALPSIAGPAPLWRAVDPDELLTQRWTAAPC